MLGKAIDSMCLAGIHIIAQAFRNRNAIDIFAYSYRMWGSISPKASQANTIKLTQPVAPHLLVVILFKQIEDY